MSIARYEVDEWGVMREQAEVLARTAIVPKNYRGKPDDIVAVALMARELDLPPIAAMSLIDVIDGSPTLNAEGKAAVVRSHGHSISGEATSERAVVRGRRGDTGDEMEVVWTIKDAERAGLANKDVWKRYTADMLWSRAVSALCRRLFSDILAGISYTPEELQGLNPADPETGELYEDPAPDPSRQAPAEAEAAAGGPKPAAPGPQDPDGVAPAPTGSADPAPAAPSGPARPSPKWMADFAKQCEDWTDDQVVAIVTYATDGDVRDPEQLLARDTREVKETVAGLKEGRLRFGEHGRVEPVSEGDLPPAVQQQIMDDQAARPF